MDEGPIHGPAEAPESGAMREAWARDPKHAANDYSFFCAGFRAGIAHARQWRKLSADPATWPEEGQHVLISDGADVAIFEWTEGFGATLHHEPQWTHWLPLPPTPPDAKGSREVESWHLPREQAAQDGKHVVVIEEPTAPQPPESPPPADEPAKP